MSYGVLYHLDLKEYFQYRRIKYKPAEDQFEVDLIDGSQVIFNYENVSKPSKAYDSSSWTGR